MDAFLVFRLESGVGTSPPSVQTNIFLAKFAVSDLDCISVIDAKYSIFCLKVATNLQLQQ